MASLTARIILFLSSYSPLLLILSLRTHKDLGWWSIIFAFVGVASVLVLIFYLRLASTLTSFSVTADSVSSKNAEAMSYIFSYVVPFIDLPFDDWKNTLSLGIFFVMLGVIYVNSNMIHINPVLNVMFYHLLEVECNGDKRSLIARRPYISRGTQIRVTKLSSEIMLEVPK